MRVDVLGNFGGAPSTVALVKRYALESQRDPIGGRRCTLAPLVEKICTACRQSKPVSCFHKDRGRRDGLFSWCKECAKEKRNVEARRKASSKWHANNPDAIRKIAARSYKKRAVRLRELSRLWRKNNPDRLRVQVKAWRKANPDKYQAIVQRRRAAQRNARGFATGGQIKARIDYYGGLCYLCGDPYQSVDHVIPLARGGTAWAANIRPACLRCNSKKGARRDHAVSSR